LIDQSHRIDLRTDFYNNTYDEGEAGVGCGLPHQYTSITEVAIYLKDLT
jgi:hypothetical protein